MRWWAVLLLLAAMAGADPAELWRQGQTARAWRELESRPRDFDSFLLRTVFLRQERELAGASLAQAELLARTPRQRCLVLLEKLELAQRSERGQLYEEATAAYEAMGAEELEVEARLADWGGILAGETGKTGVTTSLLSAAARAWERLGRASEASRAWAALASFKARLGQLDAARVALRKAVAAAGRGGSWLPILAFARTSRDWPELALDWEKLAPPGPRGVEHRVAVAATLQALGKPAAASQVLARAARAARGDPWLELLVASEQFSQAPDFATRQAIYRRALASCALLPAGQAAPWSVLRAPTWEHRMALACQRDARLRQALEHARRALEGEPRNLLYLGRILALQVELFQAGPARQTAAELRRRMLTLPSGAQRLSEFSRLRGLLASASYATRDEMSASDRLPPDSLAGQLQAELLADRPLMDRLLLDFDDWIALEASSLDRVGVPSWDKARVLALLDRPEEAEAELLRGLAVQRALGVRSWQGNLTEALARVYRQMGQWDRAEQTWRKAAALYEAAEKWVEASLAWDSLGRLLRERRRPAEAVTVARGAVELARRPSGVQSHRAACLAGLGRALWEAGQAREAAEVFAEGARLEAPVTSLVALQARALHSIGEPQALELMRQVVRRQRAREEWSELPANALSLARWEGPAGLAGLEEVARELVRFRQEAPPLTADDRELLEVLAEKLIRAGRPQEAAGWLEARAQLARPVAGLEAVQEELAALRQEVQRDGSPRSRERLQEERQRFLTRLEGLRSRYPEYERLARLRPADLAPIAADLPADAFVLQLFAAPEGVYLLGMEGERRLEHFVPVPRTRLEETVREFVRDVSEQQRPRSEAGERLAGWLLDPWRDRWKGKKLVLLPSGALSRVPLEALPGVLDECEVIHAFSSQLSRVTPGPDRRVVGLGGLAELPDTVRELNGLRELFPASECFVGSAATRAELAEVAGRADVLHLATHASSEPPYLQLADGRVTLDDILGLGLKAGSLVVLSACETGRAHQEGDLNSLAAGFRAAGASSVIASLWPVDDAATAELFGEFYRELRAGSPAAQALRTAKQRVRERRPAPYYWAGFQFLGQEW